jgi:hypothetical protein
VQRTEGSAVETALALSFTLKTKLSLLLGKSAKVAKSSHLKKFFLCPSVSAAAEQNSGMVDVRDAELHFQIIL